MPPKTKTGSVHGSAKSARQCELKINSLNRDIEAKTRLIAELKAKVKELGENSEEQEARIAELLEDNSEQERQKEPQRRAKAGHQVVN